MTFLQEMRDQRCILDLTPDSTAVLSYPAFYGLRGLANIRRATRAFNAIDYIARIAIAETT